MGVIGIALSLFPTSSRWIKRVTLQFYDHIIVSFNTTVSEIKENGTSPTPAQMMFLRSLYILNTIVAIDILLWCSFTEYYASLVSLTFLIYLFLRYLYARRKGTTNF